MSAVFFQRTDIADFLIDRGANVNARNSSGTSILILAITKRQEDIARRLIHKGADVNVQTSGNQTTALMGASHHDMCEIASLLIAKGARTDLLDAYGNSALSYAKSERMKEILTKDAGNRPANRDRC